MIIPLGNTWLNTSMSVSSWGQLGDQTCNRIYRSSPVPEAWAKCSWWLIRVWFVDGLVTTATESYLQSLRDQMTCLTTSIKKFRMIGKNYMGKTWGYLVGYFPSWMACLSESSLTDSTTSAEVVWFSASLMALASSGSCRENIHIHKWKPSMHMF